MTARLKAVDGSIEFYSPYDAGLVEGVRAIPYQDKKPIYHNGKFSHWAIAMKHKNTLIKLCEQHLGITPILQGTFAQTKTSQTKLLRVEYIGQLKDRGDGKLSAMGATKRDIWSKQQIDKILLGVDHTISTNGLEWNILLYEDVLRAFFEGSDAKESIVTTTYYSTLALKQIATQDEIKQAWRKMVRRYHPDINRDDDAAEMTQQINRAYEILRNPMTRNRYDAGLKLQQSTEKYNDPYTVDKWIKSGGLYWRPPIRCGLILADGYGEVGRFVVTRIIEWQDIVENGRTLVTSWDVDSNSLVKNWI